MNIPMSDEELRQLIIWSYNNRLLGKIHSDFFDVISAFVESQISLVEDMAITTEINVEEGKIEIGSELSQHHLETRGYWYEKRMTYITDYSRNEFYSEFIGWFKEEFPDIYSLAMSKLIDTVRTIFSSEIELF